MADLVRLTEDAETWRVPFDTRERFVRVSFDHDLDAVIVETADHKDPWVSDGERYDSFEAARIAHGLPADGSAPPRQWQCTVCDQKWYTPAGILPSKCPACSSRGYEEVC